MPLCWSAGGGLQYRVTDVDVTIVIDTFIGGEVGATTCANIQRSYQCTLKYHCSSIFETTIITTKNEFLAETQTQFNVKSNQYSNIMMVLKSILERV